MNLDKEKISGIDLDYVGFPFAGEFDKLRSVIVSEVEVEVEVEIIGLQGGAYRGEGEIVRFGDEYGRR